MCSQTRVLKGLLSVIEYIFANLPRCAYAQLLDVECTIILYCATVNSLHAHTHPTLWEKSSEIQHL